MSQKDFQYVNLLQSCIDEIVSAFEENPFNFLSEDDIKCHLFMKLWTKGDFGKFQNTEDGQKISALHSEVTYFDERYELNVHADISIINPEETDVYSEGRRHKGTGAKLSKQYEFRESFAVIEIKFNKGAWSKGNTKRYWINDLKKLRKLQKRIPNMHYFSILLDKRSHFSVEEFNEVQQRYPEITIIYGKPKSPTKSKAESKSYS